MLYAIVYLFWVYFRWPVLTSFSVLIVLSVSNLEQIQNCVSTPLKINLKQQLWGTQICHLWRSLWKGIFFSLVFSHIIMTFGSIWLFTSHRQKKISVYLPTNTNIYEWTESFWKFVKIMGQKRQKKPSQSFSIGYLGLWSFKNGPKSVRVAN